jgi:hypothetical protein
MRIDAPLITGSLNYNGTSLQDLSTYATTSSVNNLIQKTGSYALTGSNYFSGSQVVSGSITATGNITAQTLIVQTITSSVLFTTGSNIIGSSLSNVQQITGSVGITGSLAVNGTTAVVGSGTANYVPKFTASGTIGNSSIFDNGSGVSIGTTTITSIFNAQASSANVGYFNRTTTDGDILTLAVGGTNALVFNTTSGVRNILAPDVVDLALWTNGNERLRINSSGRVGIGTSSANELLVAYGLSTSRPRLVVGQLTTSTLLYSTYNTQDTPAIEVNTSTTTGFAGFTMSNSNNTSGNTLGTVTFAAAGTSNGEKRGAIIGSSLESAATSSVTANLVFYTTSASSVAERMRITSGGAVCIGTSSPIAGSNTILHVNSIEAGPTFKNLNSGQQGLALWNAGTTGNNYFIEFWTEATITARGSITFNRGSGVVAYNTTSDYRLKTEIKDFEALSIIENLKPKEFRINNSQKKSIGFIAHELQEFYPQAVNGVKDEIDDNGNPKYQGVDYSQLTGLLTKAIQELSAKIDLQQEEIEILKNK